MDYYQLTMRQIERDKEKFKSRLASMKQLEKLVTETVGVADKAIAGKKEKEKLDNFAKDAGWIFDKDTDRYYTTHGEGEDFSVGELTVPEVKLYYKLSEQGIDSLDSERIYEYSDDGEIQGFKSNVKTTVTEQTINRLKTIDPWSKDPKIKSSDKSINMWKGYTSFTTFNDPSQVSSFISDLDRTEVKKTDFDKGKYTGKFKHLYKGTYIPDSKDGDEYIEHFTIKGKLRPVLVTQEEYFLLNSGTYDRDEIEEWIKETSKKNLKAQGDKYPEIDEETGLFKFETADDEAGGGASAWSSVAFAGLGFLAGIGTKTRGFQKQKKTAKIGMEGIRSEMALARTHLGEDTQYMLDAHNKKILDLTKEFGKTGEELQTQLEGVFKASKGLASSRSTGLQEKALTTLNDAFEAQQDKLNFDFEATYDQHLRKFEAEHKSKTLQLRDLFAQYDYARKHDKWYNNII